MTECLDQHGTKYIKENYTENDRQELTTLRDRRPETLKFAFEPRFISTKEMNTMIVSNMFHLVCQNSFGSSPTNFIANSVVKIQDKT